MFFDIFPLLLTCDIDSNPEGRHCNSVGGKPNLAYLKTGFLQKSAVWGWGILLILEVEFRKCFLIFCFYY